MSYFVDLHDGIVTMGSIAFSPDATVSNRQTNILIDGQTDAQNVRYRDKQADRTNGENEKRQTER
jgi:hypothetical protein